MPRDGEFVAQLRRSLPRDSAPLVFFELPDVGRVLREIAFWDIYYEHCSYYTPGSLARQFTGRGFDVTRLELAFEDQYILLDARPGEGRDLSGAPADGVDDVRRDVESFRAGLPAQLERWREAVRAATRPVLWGSGSKGVSFLTTLGLEREIELVVDINPHKHGKFMAGTGQRIVAPEELREHRPDLVIAMNPAYLEEIGTRLSELGLDSRLVAV